MEKYTNERGTNERHSGLDDFLWDDNSKLPDWTFLKNSPNEGQGFS